MNFPEVDDRESNRGQMVVGNTMISRNKTLRMSAYGTALALCAGLAGPALATDETNWRQEMDILLQNTGSLVAFDGAGNVFLARAVGTVDNDDVWFAKYDGGGTELWSQRLVSPKIDRPLGIATDTHGNLYLAGVTEGALFGANRGDLDAWVAEFDGSGKRIWGRQFGTTEADVARSVAVGADADVHLAGTTWGPLAGVRQPRGAAWAMELDAGGHELWRRQLGTVEGTVASGVGADAAGNIFIAGLTWGNFSGDQRGGPGSGPDGWLAKLDGAGRELWRRQFGSKFGDFIAGLATGPDGSVVVAGAAEGPFAGPVRGVSDAFLIKYDGGGRELWRRPFGTVIEDTATSVSTDAAGNIYLVGHAEDVYAWAIRCDAGGRKLWHKQITIEE